MLDIVKRFFSKTESETAKNVDQATEHDVRVAACALFVEMARIDEKFTEAEMETILSIVQDRYGLSREHADAHSAWHLYTIRAPERDALQAHLRERGIASAVHYPRPIHLQPSMAAGGGKAGDLPVSEAVCRDVLCLPIYPEMLRAR